MRLTLLAVVLLSGLVPLAPVHAYPISPQTLWELTRQSRLVVLVEVEDITEETHTSEFDGAVMTFKTATAHLRVLETWKGPRLERLVVPYGDDVVCPAPPVYVKGKRAVVFLEEGDEKERRWYTTGLSYGTRYPSDAAAEEAYRDAVLGAVELQARAEAEGPREQPEPPASPVQDRPDGSRVIVFPPPEPPEPFTAERLDWQVRTALHPETRWDGLYGLAPETDLHWNYDRRPRAKVPPLSALQRELLAQAFAAAPTLDASLPMMLAVLGSYRSKQVDAALASVLEDLLREAPLDAPKDVPAWTATAMDHLATRLGRPPAHGIRKERDLYDEFSERVPDFEAVEKQQGARRRREWAELKRELCLSPAPLPRRGPEPMWGVGGNTPL
jgi:hypothetical protein